MCVKNHFVEMREREKKGRGEIPGQKINNDDDDDNSNGIRDSNNK